VDKKLSGLSTAARPAKVGRQGAGKSLERALHRNLSEPDSSIKNHATTLAVYGQTSKRDWESTKLFISPARTLQIATPETPPDPLGSDIATKPVRSGGYFKKKLDGRCAVFAFR
jgi:hypothetical protein